MAASRLHPWWLGWVVALLLAIPILWIGVGRIVEPVSRLIQALTDGAESLKDSDFSTSIAEDRSDELGELVSAHNKLGGALRHERQALFQRELLLDTVIQATDIALVLTNSNGTVVYSNASARALLHDGRPVNGLRFDDLLAGLPAAFAQAVAGGRNGLFTVEEQEPRTYHLSEERFTLNAQAHRLFLFKHLTQELSRQEVATWKKVIRLISHELNNSLAPISSLAHSGAKLLARGDTGQLDGIFATIDERASHLKNFIERYARFARLPAPQLETIDWPEFLGRLQTVVDFRVDEPLPDLRCRADPAQFEQVLINLIKNAAESGSGPDGHRRCRRTYRHDQRLYRSLTPAVECRTRCCRMRCCHSIRRKPQERDWVCRSAAKSWKRMAARCR